MKRLIMIGISCLFIVFSSLCQSGSDSLLIHHPEFIRLDYVSPSPNCTRKPVIIRTNEDLRSDLYKDCFVFKDPPDLERIDIIIWTVLHIQGFKTHVKLNIWRNFKENRYTFEAVRTKINERELNAVSSIHAYGIANIPDDAEIKFIITDD